MHDGEGCGDGFLSVHEVARLLHVDDMTVRRILDRREIPHYRVGNGTIRVLRSDVLAYLREARRS